MTRFDWMRLLPNFWLQTCRTSWEWDAMLNDLLDRHKVTRISEHMAKVGPLTIWVGNWPYAYGRAWMGLNKETPLPSGKTRCRLRDSTPEWPETDPMNQIRAIMKRDNQC